MSLAAKMIEEMEKNAELRRRFLKMILAEIALEPDVRMALANAIIREAATKTDLAELTKKIEGALEERASRIESSIVTKGEFKALNVKIETMEALVADLNKNIRSLDELGGKISSLESSVEELKTYIKTVGDLARESSSKIEEVRESLESKVSAFIENFEGRIASFKRPINIITVLSLASLAAVVLLVLLLLSFMGVI
ncbi:MAG: hypothetical protein P3X22_006035 [Thermoprotei archaeon]|nr:hypothetical protein [Thermoprotei archaeon]